MNKVGFKKKEINNKRKGVLTDSLREFVFGMEDGLVSNLGLVLGVYIGGHNSSAALLAGSASMFAGAFSMAAGSYLASKSQREMYEQEMAVASYDVGVHRKEKMTQMCKSLLKEGFEHKEVQVICNHYEKHDPSAFVSQYVSKKVGISMERLERPFEHAVVMFLSFLCGSLFPVLPFAIFTGMVSVVIAVSLTISMLFVVGVLKTRYTGRSLVKSGMEIVVVGLGAGIIGYVVGLLFS